MDAAAILPCRICNRFKYRITLSETDPDRPLVAWGARESKGSVWTESGTPTTTWETGGRWSGSRRWYGDWWRLERSTFAAGCSSSAPRRQGRWRHGGGGGGGE